MPVADRRGARFLTALVLAFCASAVACGGTGNRLTQIVEARRLASELHVQFTKAADAANVAVMADTDEASAAAAGQAGEAARAATHALRELEPILRSLGYEEERRHLETFGARFDEYKKLDAEILPLAVENTNLKAQRLSFGQAREAYDAFRRALESAVRAGGAQEPHLEALAAGVRVAVLEIRVLQAPHIAESEDEAMSRLEEQMKAAEAEARAALAQLNALTAPAARPGLAAATAALDRFMGINAEIVTLSRRNSNVRSLALSLGRKRRVVADCDDQLRALEDALATHPFPATR
jgi:hypothetical protein